LCNTMRKKAQMNTLREPSPSCGSSPGKAPDPGERSVRLQWLRPCANLRRAIMPIGARALCATTTRRGSGR